MTKRVDTSKKIIPWVDVFSGSCFTGSLQRLHPPRSAAFDGWELDKVGSIIVGPNAILKVDLRGASKPVTLSPRTILTDTSHLTPGKRRLRLVVQPAKA